MRREKAGVPSPLRGDADKFDVLDGTPFVITPYRYQKIPNPQGALESARLFLTAHALGSGTPLGPYEAVVAVGAGWMGGWSPRAATLYF